MTGRFISPGTPVSTTQFALFNVSNILYFIAAQATKDVVELAIQQFNETTCIRWVPEETAADYDLDHNSVIAIFNGE